MSFKENVLQKVFKGLYIGNYKETFRKIKIKQLINT